MSSPARSKPRAQPNPRTRRRFDSLQQEAFLGPLADVDRLRMLEDELFSRYDLTPSSTTPCAPRAAAAGRNFDARPRRQSRFTCPRHHPPDRQARPRGLVGYRERPRTTAASCRSGITAARTQLLHDIAEEVRACHLRQFGHLESSGSCACWRSALPRPVSHTSRKQTHGAEIPKTILLRSDGAASGRLLAAQQGCMREGIDFRFARR